MTGIKKINLISAVLVSLSLCGGCTLEKAGNSSQDQTVQEDNKTEQVKAEKAEKEEINEIHLRDKDSLTGFIRKEEILSAVVKSGRSYDEIMNFLNAGSDGEKTEK